MTIESNKLVSCLSSPVELTYVSAGCNLTLRVLDWNTRINLIAYGSHSSIHLYKPEETGVGGIVLQTLCGHKGRVNAVRWFHDDIPDSNSFPELVTASSDGSVRVWSLVDGKYTNSSEIIGHSGSVNDVSAIFMSKSNGTALIASSATDFTVKLWLRNIFGGSFDLIDTIELKRSLCVSLELSVLSRDDPLTAVLAYCTEHPSVILASVSVKGSEVIVKNKIVALTGHEDWIRGLAFTSAYGPDLYLASSSQDTSVRVWRISREDTKSSVESTIDPSSHEFKMEKKIFHVGDESYNVSLETVLLGHEGWVYSSTWFPPQEGSGLQLMTFSFDHSIILWSPEEESGIWFESVRLGNVGGEALGFLGGAVGPGGRSVVAHTHQGSLNLWCYSLEEEKWHPKYICGGHFSEVTDLAWEPNGHYLLSVSTDQTTRLHTEWSSRLAKNKRSLWFEMARPQVHGYGMNSVTTLPNFRFVSAADEKVARAFGAPRNFLENLRSLCQTEIANDVIEMSSEPMGATVPALGLSNQAVYSKNGRNVEGQNDTDASYFSRQLLQEPPADDFLSQNSLWPETMKLYGHGYEVYSVAASHNGRFIVTACKATSAEHATIILWDTSNWEKIHSFEGKGHTLTITQMCFSYDDSYILSVSRDRNWVVHRILEDGTSYKLLATTDRKTGVHSRIIWTCAWSHDSEIFVTGSREGVCAVWSGQCLKSVEELCSVAIATKEWLAGPVNTFTESVTTLSIATFLPLGPDTKSYLIAVGTEYGNVLINLFSLGKADPWSLVTTIDHFHSATISRLSFCPKISYECPEKNPILHLATASHDHSVKIFTLRPSLV